jgi:hypothetical protein
MTTVNRCLAPVTSLGISETLKRVLIGQAQSASNGLRYVTEQQGSLYDRVAREKLADPEPIPH